MVAAVTWYLWKSGRLWSRNDDDKEEDQGPSEAGFAEKATTVQEMVARLQSKYFVQ